MNSLSKRWNWRAAAPVLLGMVALFGMIDGCRHGPSRAPDEQASEGQASQEKALEGHAAETTPVPKAPDCPPEPVERQELTPECTDWGKYRGGLALLAIRALEIFGRVDPALYVRDKTGQWTVDPGAKPRKGQTRAAFDDALKAINAEVGASRAFERGYALSRKAFEALAPEVKSYDVVVVRLDDGKTHVESYRWFVKDGPTEDVWAQIFAPLYATPPIPCPLLERLTVEDRHTGLAQPRGVGTFPAEFGPCPCKINGTRGRSYEDEECGEPRC